MGIQSLQDTANITNLRYSAFLGMLYVSNPDTEALIKEAKALVGESEVKKGFQGNKGDSSSAKAIAFLQQKNLFPVKVKGDLSSARIIEKDIEGRKTPYLNVGLKDVDGKYFISIDACQEAAQMLVRKLANAQIGVYTEISMFAKYGQREGATRPYADHGCSLKQGDEEIKGVDPKEKLVPLVNAALKALEDAGVSQDDKETFAKRRAKVELDFHLSLMEAVSKEFSVFYSKNGVSESAEADAAILEREPA